MSIQGAYFYPGSRPFEDTDIDRKLFFGREQEKEDLLQKVLARKLVVLFAKSGLGKTSLINAGVSRLLREKGCVPLKVRFNHTETNPIQTVYDSIKDRAAQFSLDWEPGEEKTLWEYFKTAAFWSAGDSLMTPVLILDQFEEFFAFHEPEARKAFILQLADLVNGTIPSHLRQVIREGEPFPYGENPPEVKVLVSIREDQLGLLEEFSSEIPDILRNRYRLSALTRDQAREAIVEPPQVQDEHIGTTGFEYADDTLNAMLDYLSKAKERGGVVIKDEIESFQLQLLCRHIESDIREKKKKGGGTDGFVVKEEDLGGEPGMQKVLQDFYENQLAGLETFSRRRRARRLCESGLISASDRRLSLEEEEIERRFKISPPLLARLVDSRLLRAERRVGSVYYELSHDTLLVPIQKSQKKRISKKKVLGGIIGIFVLIGIVLLIDYIIMINQQNRVNKLYNEAWVLIYGHKYYKAIEVYKRAIDIDPIDASYPYSGWGYALLYLKKYDDAIEKFKKGIEIDPKNAYAYNGWGSALVFLKEYSEAIKKYEKALEIDSDLFYVKKNLAEAYLFGKNFDKAYDLANEVLKGKDISTDVIMVMRFISIAALIFQGKQSETLTQLKEFIIYYKSLAEDYDRSWSYNNIKDFISDSINQNKKLSPQEIQLQSLLFRLIDLLESPKKEGDKILKELEKMMK